MIPPTTADGDHLDTTGSDSAEAVEDMLYTQAGADPVADDVANSGMTQTEIAGIAAVVVALLVLWGWS